MESDIGTPGLFAVSGGELVHISVKIAKAMQARGRPVRDQGRGEVPSAVRRSTTGI